MKRRRMRAFGRVLRMPEVAFLVHPTIMNKTGYLDVAVGRRSLTPHQEAGRVMPPFLSRRVSGNRQAFRGPLRICLTKSVFLRRCREGIFGNSGGPREASVRLEGVMNLRERVASPQ